MTDIDLRFTGYANFKQVQGQVASLQKQFATLNTEMARAATGTQGQVAPLAFARQAKAAKEMSRTYADALESTGKFDVQQKRLQNGTQSFIKDLEKQRLTFSKIWKERKLYNESLKEQIRLQRMSVSTMGGVSTIAVPRGDFALKGLEKMRMEAGMLSTALKSGSTQMINFGKNTQWSGRQLSTGFTMPLIALGVLSGKAAYDVNKNLTDIAKVYDTTADLIGTSSQKAASRERELQQLRNDGLATATTLAEQYGARAKDTLAVQAQLAAVGMQGVELQQNTISTQRLAILGEFDYQKAIDASIALQSIYKYSSQELSDTLNYMNSVENATSLSMEDFASAIPIAAGPIQNLGADVKDLGFLLTAMKERGVGAVQGANALKSGLTRLLRPSQQVQSEFAELTGKSLPELTAQSKGELIPLLREISGALDGLSDVDRQKALSGLFGSYQVSRLSSLLKGIEDGYNGVGQSAKALEVAGYSAEKNLGVANEELARKAESASGRFDRAFASIEVQLAKTGETFLNVATKGLELVKTLFDLYGALPGPIKGALKFGVVLTAIGGPLLMLTGLMANMAGQSVKALSALGLMATKFVPLTTESAALAKVQEVATRGLGRQAQAATTLNQQLDALNKSLAATAAAQQRSASVANKAAYERITTERQATAETERAAKANIRANIERAQAEAVNMRAIRARQEAEHAAAVASFNSRFRPGSSAAARLGPQAPSYIQDLGMPGLRPGMPAQSPLGPARPTDAQLKNAQQYTPPIGNIPAGVGSYTGPMSQSSTSKTNLMAYQSHLDGGTASLAKQVQLETEKTEQMGRQVVFGAAMTASTIAMMQPWSQNVQKAGEYAMLISLAAPLISVMWKGLSLLPAQWTKINASAKAAMATQTGGASKVGALFKAGLGSLNAWAVAIAAAGVGMYALYKNSQKAGKAWDNIYKNTDKLGEILGFTPAENAAPVKVKNEDGSESMRSSTENIKKFNEAYGDVTKAIQATNSEQEKLNLATAQGLKVINAGGTADQARQAVKLALDSAMKVTDANRLMLKFDVDFNQMDQVVKAQLSNAQSIVDKAVKMDKDQGFAESLFSLDNAKDFLKGPFGDKGAGRISDEARKAGQNAGSAFAEAWSASLNQDVQVQNSAVQKTVMGLNSILGNGSDQNVKQRNEALKQFLIDTGTQASLAEDVTSNLGAQANIASVIAKYGINITDSMGKQLTILRQNGFLSGMVASIQGAIGNAANNQTSAVRNTNSELSKQLDLNQRIAAAVGATQAGNPMFATKTKEIWESSMTSAWQSVGGMMNTALDASFQGQIDALSARGQAAADALEARSKKRQDALEASQKKRQADLEKSQKAAQEAFDKRWKKRKDKLEKEEELRKRIFDAEMNRIEREKQINSTSVDYRVAMAEGNLDEASRIRGDATAQVDTWAMEDADEKARLAYDRAQERLKAQEDKEAKRLDARQKREKDALDKRLAAEKAGLDKRIAAEKAAQQRSNQIAQAGAQRQIEINKAKIQSQLAADLAYVPTSEADAQRHIDRLAKKYERYGLNLKGMSKQYGNTLHSELLNNIQKNANELQTKIDWAGLAKGAANKYVKAIWGKDLKSFLKWVDLNTKKEKTKPNNSPIGDGPGQQINHGGGFVGAGSTGRKGYRGAKSSLEQSILAEKGEFLVQKSAAAALGPAALHELNNAHKTKFGTDGPPPKRGTGGIGMTGVESNTLGQMMNLGMKKQIKALGLVAKRNEKKAKEKQISGNGASGGSTGGSMKGVDPNGWNKPWAGHHTTSNGHDYNLIDKPIYAPHSGTITTHALKGYEPRLAAKGYPQNGFKSYGQWVDFNGGGTNLMFAHLSKLPKAGKVKAGQYMGTTGATGNAYGKHVHVERNHTGNNFQFGEFFRNKGISLRKGGELKYDNTLVNAHKGETVLTDNLTDKFKQGVENYSKQSPGNNYGDIIVQVPEGTKDPEAFGRKAAIAMKKQLDYEESRYGK